MAGSRTFGSKIPFKGHLNRGTGGVQAEITKLRQEIDQAFFTLEQDGQLAQVHIDTVDPTVNDDSTQGFETFSRWINSTPPAKEFVCISSAPGAANWQEVTNQGPGGIVFSVFARTGNITSAVGDYDASQVDNDSLVAGASVADALNNLLAAIPAPAPVFSVFGRIGAVVAMVGDYTSTQKQSVVDYVMTLEPWI